MLLIVSYVHMLTNVTLEQLTAGYAHGVCVWCTRLRGTHRQLTARQAARLARRRVACLLRDSPSMPCLIWASISRLRLHACYSTVQTVYRVIAATNQSPYESRKLGGLVRPVCCLLL